MLFKRKRCEKCGKTYDSTFSECPKCHQKDGNFRKLGIPKSISWLEPWQQIALFISGFVFGALIDKKIPTSLTILIVIIIQGGLSYPLFYLLIHL